MKGLAYILVISICLVGFQSYGQLTTDILLYDDAIQKLSLEESCKILSSMEHIKDTKLLEYSDEVARRAWSKAVKFHPYGHQALIHILSQVQQKFMIIDIIDDGIGIQVQEPEHVSDLFYKANNNEVAAEIGVGVGLSSVKKIAYQHHGKFNLQNNTQGRLTVTIILPLA